MGKFVEWINERWPVRAVVRWGLDEEIVGGSSFFFTLGSSALFVFLVQVATGVWQLFYYVPTKDHAYDSLIYLRLETPFGWLVHGLHYWGSNAFVVLLALHVARVFVWGAHKKPRELTWLVGVALLLLVLSMTFTGPLLAWDQLGYWAAEVGVSIGGTVPVIGGFAERVLRGGSAMGQLSLSRFFALHVAILAGLLGLFIGIHLLAFRQYGSVGPWNPERRKRAGAFWPDQAFKDLVVISAILLLLIGLAAFAPAPIAGPADPLDRSYTPKPEWNFLFLYQAVKAFKGAWEPIGTVGVPLALILLLALLPFYDRREERSPARRPFAMAGGFALAALLVALTVLGYTSHPGAPSSPARRTPPASLSAAGRQGEHLFAQKGCIGCHTIGGRGGHVGPDLSKEGGAGRSRAWLMEQIRNPQSHFPKTVMPPFKDLSDRQVSDLVDYLLSQRTAGPPAAAPAPALPASGEQGPPGPAATMIGDASRGGLLFAQRCQFCHGPEGTGKVPNPGSEDGTVPPLKPMDPELTSRDPQAFAAKVDPFIQHGSTPDGPHPARHMPAFGDTESLTQAQIASIEAYVLALNGVDRARIRHPGVLPRIFFAWTAGALGLVWVGLGIWWAALRKR